MKSEFLAILIAAGLAAPPALGQAEGEVRPGGAGAPAAAEAPGAEAPSAEAPHGRVERAGFTTAVVEREPQDAITTLTNDHERILYFSELRDLEGETVTHRWEFGGRIVAEVSFDVGGPRWRVHSSKTLVPAWLGDWTVSVVDSTGTVLRTDSFTLVEAAPERTPETAPAARTEPTEAASGAAPTPPANLDPGGEPSDGSGPRE